MACEELIQFDIEAVTTNLSNRYAMLEFVNQQNYDEMKKSNSANFPEYFSGSYEDFKLKRNELTKLFIAAGYSNLQSSSYRRTLSAASAEAYERCMAENSHKPISAWIGKYTDTQIAINLHNGLNEDVDYTVVGEKPSVHKGVLPIGGTQIIMFDYSPNRDFMVAFNGVSRKTKTAGAALIQLEKLRHFEIRKTQKQLTANFSCGAGCQGSPTGCSFGKDAVFVAEDDYYLLFDTHKVVHEEVPADSPGLLTYELQWSAESDTRPRRVTAHPVNMRGNSKDTQGIVFGTCTIIAEREYIVEVVPTAGPAT